MYDEQLIVVNKETTKPLIDQLINKYPCLTDRQDWLRDTIKMFMSNCSSVGGELLYNGANRYSPEERLLYLAQSISDNIDHAIEHSNWNNQNIIKHYSEEFFKDNYLEEGKLDALYIYEMTDFKTIIFASHFYGKSIDDLARDAMEMCNYDHSIFRKVNEQIFEKFVHMIECEILSTLGVMFFVLKIAMILECFDVKTINSILLSILACVKEDKPYTHASLDNERLNLIYQMYHEQMAYISSLDYTDYQKYNRTTFYPDNYLFEDCDIYFPQSPYKVSHFLIIIPKFIEQAIAEENAKSSKISDNLMVNIIDMTNTSLEIDI